MNWKSKHPTSLQGFKASIGMIVQAFLVQFTNYGKILLILKHIYLGGWVGGGGGGGGGFRLLGKYRSDIFPKNRTFFLLGKMSWPRWGQRTNRPKKCSSWKTQLGHFIMTMSALIFYRLFYILGYKDCWEKEKRSNEKFVEEYWSSDYFRPKKGITGSLHNKKRQKKCK